MKNEILQRLDITLSALNTVSVNGKANLANLSGSIAMIEEVYTLLKDAEVKSPEKKDG